MHPMQIRASSSINSGKDTYQLTSGEKRKSNKGNARGKRLGRREGKPPRDEGGEGEEAAGGKAEKKREEGEIRSGRPNGSVERFRRPLRVFIHIIVSAAQTNQESYQRKAGRG